MSLQAYQRAASSAESPREAEFRLFAQVTRALTEAAKTDRSDIQGRIDALHWNRQVWSVLGSDCADSANPLPKALKASIISLSLWVSSHTSLVIRGEDDIEDLIEVNRMMMQGLAGEGASVAAA